MWWTIGVLAGLVVLYSLFAAVWAGPSVLRTARSGRSALVEGSAAFLQRNADLARREFEDARKTFGSSEQRLGSPLMSPMRRVPLLGPHIAVARSLSAIGARAADAGLAATGALSALPEHELRLLNGRMDLGLVRRAASAFRGSLGAVEEIGKELEQMPESWVVSSLDKARREALDFLPTAIDGIRKGKVALDAMPSLLAETGFKRYLIAFSNLAELRGTGGFIGFVTSLKAENGDLDLEDLSGRPTEIFPPPAEISLTYPEWFPRGLRDESGIFQNINLTTDFPTAGSLIAQTAQAAWGQVDGVIGVDPNGLAAVLRLTGQISVPPVPTPITWDNVSRIAQYDVYRFIQNNDEREDFFGRLVRTAFDKLTSADIRIRPETVGFFDAQVRAGHFRMYSKHAQDQTAFTSLDLAGGVDRASGATDVLSVVTVNAAGNKADWFLRRDMSFEVRLDPDAGTATGDLSVTLQNNAPPVGLPDYIIGSYVPGLPRGSNRQIVTVLRPGDDHLESFTIGGEARGAERDREASLRAYRTSTDLASRSASSFRFRSAVPDAFEREGNETIYRLMVLGQPVAHPDRYDVVVDVPRGWHASGRTRFTGELTQDLIFEVHLVRTGRGSVVEKVFLEPWRLARRLVGRVF